MIRALLLALFLCITHLCIGQSNAPSPLKTKKKTKWISKWEKETFYALKKQKKVRHGEYFIETNNKKRLVEGQYEMGEKIGVWTFYSNNKVLQKFDYTNQELVYRNPADKNQKYKVWQNNRYIETSIDYEPTILGGSRAILKKIFQNLKLPKSAQNQGAIEITPILTVNQKGEIESIVLKQSINSEIDQAGLEAIAFLKEEKIYPAIKDGQPIRIKWEIPFTAKRYAQVERVSVNSW